MPARAGGHPRILLLGTDPYLAFLVRREFPDARILQAHPGAAPGPGDEAVQAGARVDVAIVDLNDPHAGAMLASHSQGNVIGIADGRSVSGRIDQVGVHQLVFRPIIPSELYRAIRQQVAPGVAEAEPDDRPSLRAHWLLGLTRLALVALAGATVASAQPPAAWAIPLLVAMTGYAAVCLVRRRRRSVGALTDLLLAAAAIAISGGMASAYAPFGALAAVETGLVWGVRRGPLAGLLPALGVATLMIAAGHGAVPASPLLAWTALFPLASLTAAHLGRRSQAAGTDGVEQLAEANRVLSSLLRIARTAPDALDIPSVSAACVEELRCTAGAPAGALVLREAGLVTVMGSFGLPGWEDFRLPESAVAAGLFPDAALACGRIEVPAPFAAALDRSPRWAVAPLRRDGATFGLILAACSGTAEEPMLLALQRLADETALAMENARLFARVRDLSADEERRRLARELHDGVAQDLMHVRLELEMLAQRGPAPGAITDEVGAEVARLARVAAHALSDVRATIDGLRPPLAGGLADALRCYVRDLQRLGDPRISFVATGTTARPPAVDVEVFRVAQEAASNAVRHARASHITVRLESQPDLLRLVVEDDGIGLPPAPATRSGLGLDTMRERALNIGGSLSIGASETGGTRVELLVDERPAVPGAPAGGVVTLRAGVPVAPEALSA